MHPFFNFQISNRNTSSNAMRRWNCNEKPSPDAAHLWMRSQGSVAKRTSLRVKQGAFGGLFEQNLCVEIVFIWFHDISCNRCSIFTCGCTSYVIILFLWLRFRPRMRTIRRLLQSLHWPNLHHEFLKWVRNSAGETCSLSLSQTDFRHRGQLYDTCFTLFHLVSLLCQNW